MLKINDLKVSYNTKNGVVAALGPLNMEIGKGDIVAIIGPSGCGKSTLLKVLGGIVSNFTGEVALQGEPLSTKVHSIGLIPQGFGLLPWKTVEENCILGLKIKNTLNKDSLDRLKAMMKTLDIDTLRNRYPSEISGGQKQRAAIARAFIMNPQVLLMDEPFSALDAITREEAQELFLSIWNKHKTTTIVVTHSIDEAIYMGKNIVIMGNCPGNIIKVIENPLFNIEHMRDMKEYGELSSEIREVIKKCWKQ
ncbi:MAG: ABC transporter ATP-binding protein [Clostridium sp.]